MEKKLTRAPERFLPVNSMNDLPPSEITFRVDVAGEAGRLGQTGFYVLWQGVWFGFTQAHSG